VEKLAALRYNNQRMSGFPKTLSITLAIFLALFLYNKFGPPFSFSSTVTQKTDLFTVSGEGKVTVVPDTGLVDLGINLTRPSVKSAQTDVNNIINAISADTKKLGVDAKDLKTSNYSIYPEYDYRTGTGRITGYRVSASLTIKVRDLEKINSVIDTATADGANTVSGIQLTVDDEKQKQLLQQAREEAITEAKTKAESLARAAGITLGRIVNVQESGDNTPRPVFYAAKDIAAGLGGGGETQIQPGSTDITSSVTLFYETRYFFLINIF
jgi:uncharacterized protein YggE